MKGLPLILCKLSYLMTFSPGSSSSFTVKMPAVIMDKEGSESSSEDEQE